MIVIFRCCLLLCMITFYVSSQDTWCLRGKVVDEQGLSLSGLLVSVSSNYHFSSEGCYSERTNSDSSGFFSFCDMPYADDSSFIVGTGSGDLWGIAVVSGNDSDFISITLKPTLVVTGMIIDDSTGTPVSNAAVSMYIDGFRSVKTFRTKKTDEDGVYRIEGIPAGNLNYYLYVNPYYHLADSLLLNTEGFTPESEITKNLEVHREHISLTVNAVEGCTGDTIQNFTTMFALRDSPNDTVAVVTRETDVTALLGGHYYSWTVADGFNTLSRSYFSYSDGDTFTVRMNAIGRDSGSIYFIVKDSSGNPIDSVSVQPLNYWLTDQHYTDSNGEIYLFNEFTIDQRNFCGGRGTHTFTFWKSGYKVRDETIEISSLHDTAYITLFREEKGKHLLQGIVSDSTGALVANSYISILVKHPGESMINYFTYGYTDSFGRYSILYPYYPESPFGNVRVVCQNIELPDTTDFLRFSTSIDSVLLTDSITHLDIIAKFKRYQKDTSVNVHKIRQDSKKRSLKFINGTICVSNNRPGTLRIFTIDGRLIYSQGVPKGNQRLPLPQMKRTSSLLIAVYEDGRKVYRKMFSHLR